MILKMDSLAEAVISEQEANEETGDRWAFGKKVPTEEYNALENAVRKSQRREQTERMVSAEKKKKKAVESSSSSNTSLFEAMKEGEAAFEELVDDLAGVAPVVKLSKRKNKKTLLLENLKQGRNAFEELVDDLARTGEPSKPMARKPVSADAVMKTAVPALSNFLDSLTPIEEEATAARKRKNGENPDAGKCKHRKPSVPQFQTIPTSESNTLVPTMSIFMCRDCYKALNANRGVMRFPGGNEIVQFGVCAKCAELNEKILEVLEEHYTMFE